MFVEHDLETGYIKKFQGSPGLCKAVTPIFGPKMPNRRNMPKIKYSGDLIIATGSYWSIELGSVYLIFLKLDQNVSVISLFLTLVLSCQLDRFQPIMKLTEYKRSLDFKLFVTISSRLTNQLKHIIFRSNIDSTLADVKEQFSSLQSELSAATLSTEKSTQFVKSLELLAKKREAYLCKYGFQPTKRDFPSYPETTDYKAVESNTSNFKVDRYDPSNFKRTSQGSEIAQLLPTKEAADPGEKTYVISQESREKVASKEPEIANRTVDIGNMLRAKYGKQPSDDKFQKPVSVSATADHGGMTTKRLLQRYSVLPAQFERTPSAQSRIPGNSYSVKKPAHQDLIEEEDKVSIENQMPKYAKLSHENQSQSSSVKSGPSNADQAQLLLQRYSIAPSQSHLLETPKSRECEASPANIALDKDTWAASGNISLEKEAWVDNKIDNTIVHDEAANELDRDLTLEMTVQIPHRESALRGSRSSNLLDPPSPKSPVKSPLEDTMCRTPDTRTKTADVSVISPIEHVVVGNSASKPKIETGVDSSVNNENLPGNGPASLQNILSKYSSKYN